jgi:hypothetical protein
MWDALQVMVVAVECEMLVNYDPIVWKQKSSHVNLVDQRQKTTVDSVVRSRAMDLMA